MSINDGANALGSSSQIEVIVATAAMTGDNSKGLALAISSSLFIGASFIIKKKGLKKAGSTGMRAGEWHVEINVVSEVVCLYSIGSQPDNKLFFDQGSCSSAEDIAGKRPACFCYY
jgi:hypothetical protein